MSSPGERCPRPTHKLRKFSCPAGVGIFYRSAWNISQQPFSAIRACVLFYCYITNLFLCSFKVIALPLSTGMLFYDHHICAMMFFHVSVFLVSAMHAGAQRVQMTPAAGSLAPPCSNLWYFGSKCIALKKVRVTLLGLFGGR